MVPDAFTHALFRLRPSGSVDSFQAEQSVDGLGVNSRDKLTLRISQQIFRGAANIDRTRRYKPQQHMLIEGQVILPVDEITKSIAVTPGCVRD